MIGTGALPLPSPTAHRFFNSAGFSIIAKWPTPFQPFARARTISAGLIQNYSPWGA